MVRVVCGLILVALGGVLISTPGRAEITVEIYPYAVNAGSSEPRLADMSTVFRVEEEAPAVASNSRVATLGASQSIYAAGYVPIGYIRAKDFKCRDESCSRLLEKVMKRARNAGAEFVDEAYQSDRQEQKTRTRTGKCLDWTTINTQRYYCPNVGGASCRYIDAKQPYCLRYETSVVRKKGKTLRTASYILWAKKPDLAKAAYLNAGLSSAVIQMDKELVDLWIERGADVRHPYVRDPISRLLEATSGQIWQAEQDGTPTEPIRQARLGFVEFLVSRGADPDAPPVHSWFAMTPLMYAVRDNDYEMFKLLIDLGASVLNPRLTTTSSKWRRCTYDQPCPVLPGHFQKDDVDQRIIELIVENERRENPDFEPIIIPDSISRNPFGWKGW